MEGERSKSGPISSSLSSPTTQHIAQKNLSPPHLTPQNIPPPPHPPQKIKTPKKPKEHKEKTTPKTPKVPKEPKKPKTQKEDKNKFSIKNTLTPKEPKEKKPKSLKEKNPKEKPIKEKKSPKKVAGKSPTPLPLQTSTILLSNFGEKSTNSINFGEKSGFSQFHNLNSVNFGEKSTGSHNLCEKSNILLLNNSRSLNIPPICDKSPLSLLNKPKSVSSVENSGEISNFSLSSVRAPLISDSLVSCNNLSISGGENCEVIRRGSEEGEGELLKNSELKNSEGETEKKRARKLRKPTAEEDIIDGFAILAFKNYEELTRAIKLGENSSDQLCVQLLKRAEDGSVFKSPKDPNSVKIKKSSSPKPPKKSKLLKNNTLISLETQINNFTTPNSTSHNYSISIEEQLKTTPKKKKYTPKKLLNSTERTGGGKMVSKVEECGSGSDEKIRKRRKSDSHPTGTTSKKIKNGPSSTSTSPNNLPPITISNDSQCSPIRNSPHEEQNSDGVTNLFAFQRKDSPPLSSADNLPISSPPLVELGGGGRSLKSEELDCGRSLKNKGGEAECGRSLKSEGGGGRSLKTKGELDCGRSYKSEGGGGRSLKNRGGELDCGRSIKSEEGGGSEEEEEIKSDSISKTPPLLGGEKGSELACNSPPDSPSPLPPHTTSNTNGSGSGVNGLSRGNSSRLFAPYANLVCESESEEEEEEGLKLEEEEEEEEEVSVKNNKVNKCRGITHRSSPLSDFTLSGSHIHHSSTSTPPLEKNGGGPSYLNNSSHTSASKEGKGGVGGVFGSIARLLDSPPSSSSIPHPLISSSHSYLTLSPPNPQSPTLRERDSLSSNVSSLSHNSSGGPSTTVQLPRNLSHHSLLSYSKAASWLNTSVPLSESSSRVSSTPPLGTTSGSSSSSGSTSGRISTTKNHSSSNPTSNITSNTSTSNTATSNTTSNTTSSNTTTSNSTTSSNLSSNTTTSSSSSVKNSGTSDYSGGGGGSMSMFAPPLLPLSSLLPPPPSVSTPDSIFSGSSELVRRDLESRFLRGERGSFLSPASAAEFHQRELLSHLSSLSPHTQHPPLFTPPPLFKDMKMESHLYRNLGMSYPPPFNGLLPPTLSTPFTPPSQIPPIPPRRSGRWNAMHVRIAWEIYHHQQKGTPPPSTNLPSSSSLPNGSSPLKGLSPSTSHSTSSSTSTTSTNPLSNTSNLLSNTTNVLSNSSNVLSGSSNVLSNTSGMLSNSGGVLSNSSNVLSNSGGVLSNSNNILSNSGGVSNSSRGALSTPPTHLYGAPLLSPHSGGRDLSPLFIHAPLTSHLARHGGFMGASFGGLSSLGPSLMSQNLSTLAALGSSQEHWQRLQRSGGYGGSGSTLWPPPLPTHNLNEKSSLESPSNSSGSGRRSRSGGITIDESRGGSPFRDRSPSRSSSSSSSSAHSAPTNLPSNITTSNNQNSNLVSNMSSSSGSKGSSPSENGERRSHYSKGNRRDNSYNYNHPPPPPPSSHSLGGRYGSSPLGSTSSSSSWAPESYNNPLSRYPPLDLPDKDHSSPPTTSTTPPTTNTSLSSSGVNPRLHTSPLLRLPPYNNPYAPLLPPLLHPPHPSHHPLKSPLHPLHMGSYAATGGGAGLGAATPGSYAPLGAATGMTHGSGAASGSGSSIGATNESRASIGATGGGSHVTMHVSGASGGGSHVASVGVTHGSGASSAGSYAASHGSGASSGGNYTASHGSGVSSGGSYASGIGGSGSMSEYGGEFSSVNGGRSSGSGLKKGSEEKNKSKLR